jgi:trehalose 6-phosphate synthase/phosphatase
VSAVPKLDLARLIPRYKHSQQRLLLIEFEGTLWQREISRGLLSPFMPSQDAVDLLNKLAEDGRNEVWLLSGLPVRGMMEVVAEKVPKIGIV